MARSRTTHPGRALTEKQDRFAQGVSNSEACRVVGINRRTGTRWRFGRTIFNTAGVLVHYPPVRIAAAPRARHPRYLSLAERTVIADLRREHRTVRDIASLIGRSPATVRRELRRNVDHKGRYLPLTAERLAAQRVPRPRARRLSVDVELRTVVMGLLEQRWSPEQVAQELQRLFPEQRQRQLCVETLYQAIYDSAVPVTRPVKRRRLPAMTMIADRPAEVADRVQPGHWEGDCVMGAGNRSAIGTLVERRTRFLIHIRVPRGRLTAKAMRAGITSALGRLPAQLRRTLTWDSHTDHA